MSAASLAMATFGRDRWARLGSPSAAATTWARPEPPWFPPRSAGAIVEAMVGLRTGGGQGRGGTETAGPVEEQAGRADLAERAEELERERARCARARAGDRRAMAELLRKHGPALYRSVLLPRLGNEAAAQDALAETYLRVVERFSQFEWRGCGVYPWLRVIAMRIALDMLRGGRREALFDPNEMSRAVDRAERDWDEGAEAQLCQKRDLERARARFEQALGTINQRYALAIRIRVVDERSREDAARELGVSVATFDVVLHRALAALRKAIKAQEVTP